MMSARGQQGEESYEDRWKAVEELVKKGLPKSALEEVQKIYGLAKKDKQPAELVKSLLYISALQGENREDNFQLSIRELEEEVTDADEPVKSVMYSILAGKLQQYFQQKRWVIYNRTPLSGQNSSDPDTWSAEEFNEKISHYFLLSISKRQTLRDTKLEQFEPVLSPGNTRKLRPTLYDFLVHRALGYFTSDEGQLVKPAYQFQIDQSRAFADVESFSSWRIDTRDTLSLKYKALILFQEILAFHQKDKDPDALIDADLLRLQFVYNHSVHPGKDTLYVAALKSVTSKYGNHPAAAQAWYLLASWHDTQAGNYVPHGDTTHRFESVKALEIARRVIRDNPETEGGQNASNLVNKITAKSLTYAIERVNLPDLPFRVLIDYRNIQSLYLKIVKIESGSGNRFENLYDQNIRTELFKQKSVREWEQSLPDPLDYQGHRAEIKVDGLPVGDYALIASSHSDPGNEAAATSVRVFHVSAISFVNSANDYFILHRDEGMPLAGASVQVWRRVYNNQRRTFDREKKGVYSTDANGRFSFVSDKSASGDRAYLLDIRHGKDRLFMNEQLYDLYEVNGGEKRSHKAFFFTDRSLYRPGQTVYFKAIVLKGDDQVNQLLTSRKITVVLRNANFEDVDSLSLTTNAFGSLKGEFRLPATGLGGHFSVYTKGGEGEFYFRVEAYKRPTFFVEYDTLKNTYALNEQIGVTGKVEAYAGNKMTGARVKYRVVREARFLYPWLLKRWWFPRSEPVEIAHGEVLSDENGLFLVRFDALPDLTIKRELDPVFDYRIYTDVTDESGETRSAERTVSIGYTAIVMRFDLPERAGVREFRSITINTENLSGQPVSAPVQVKVIRLKVEDRLIRERYWQSMI